MSEPKQLLRPLSRREGRWIYRWEMKKAFPAAELKPLWSILSMMAAGEYDALGLFRGEELLGYALLRRGASFVLLDYLAACQGKEGRGTGSAILTELKERYAHTAGILAEAEAVEEGVSQEENELRQRRLSFYARNGFTDLGYEADIFTVRYAILGWSAQGTPERNAAMEAHRALYRLRILEPLYRRYVHIPV